MATIIQPVRAVYYGRYGQYDRCMVHTLASAAGVAGAAGAWFIRTRMDQDATLAKTGA